MDDELVKELANKLTKAKRANKGQLNQSDARAYFKEILTEVGKIDSEKCYYKDDFGFEVEFDQEAFNMMFL